MAERGDQVVGFAFASPTDHPDATKGLAPARDLHFYSLYLLANEQGSGIGTALLVVVLADRSAQLWVLSSNNRARAFYEHHEFQDDGSEFADPDIDGLVEVRMVR